MRNLPARMLNEHVYCPRLFALEWLHALWADNAFTADGQRVHRHVDREDPRVGFEGRTRSVSLSDDQLRLTAKIDVLEERGGTLIPVDFKRGKPARNEHGVWEPERVQLCAQALLLRAHGYVVTRAAVWFAGARRRVEVEITKDLVATTLAHRDAALQLAQQPDALPEPLVDSPKCPGCSLVGICLPDETHHLKGRTADVRPLVPARDDALPLHVDVPGAFLGKDHAELVVREKREVLARARMEDTSQVVLHGRVGISTPLLHELARRGIPVAWYGHGGWFRGIFHDAGGHNVFGRIAQFRAADDPAASISLARAFVGGKIRNQRVLLRRNGLSVRDEPVKRLKELAVVADRTLHHDQLLGVEGAAARIYFQHFASMLSEGALGDGFDFTRRERRPPTDPINALLGFAYACLVRECTVALARVGLDPYVGFLHRPRHGRPALALDLMEELRPVLADSAVIRAVNTGGVASGDFVVRSTGTSLTRPGRKKFVRFIEQRLDQQVTHPAFGTRLSWRRVIEVQARLLGKVLMGELETYPAFRVR